ILQPVCSTMLRIILPPGPISSRILSVGIFIEKLRGAYGDMVSRGLSMVFTIISRMCKRALRACSSASLRMEWVTFGTLMSICSARDVGEHGVILALHHQAHCNARHRSRDRHTGVHQ